MLRVSGRESTKTGFAPDSANALAVDTNVKAGTITSTEAKSIRTALHALPKEDITAIRDGVLVTLVSNNTITQTQANAIKAAKASWVGKMGSRHGADLGTAKTASLTY